MLILTGQSSVILAPRSLLRPDIYNLIGNNNNKERNSSATAERRRLRADETDGHVDPWASHARSATNHPAKSVTDTQPEAMAKPFQHIPSSPADGALHSTPSANFAREK
jgi:hypothetical protein